MAGVNEGPVQRPPFISKGGKNAPQPDRIEGRQPSGFETACAKDFQNPYPRDASNTFTKRFLLNDTAPVHATGTNAMHRGT